MHNIDLPEVISVVSLVMTQIVAVLAIVIKRLFARLDKIAEHLAILNGRTTKVETLADIAATNLLRKEAREWDTKA